MVLLATMITMFGILLGDAINQAAGGSSTFVPDRGLMTAFIVVVMIFGPYTVVYITSVVLFFIKRERANGGSNVLIKLNNDKVIQSEEVKKMNKRFNAEIVDDTIETKGNLKYTYVLEEHETNKSIIWKFAFYLLQENFLVMLLLILAGYGISIVLLFTNQILFWILLGFFTLFLIMILFINLYYVPNKLYQRTVNNKLPTSVRAYEDRVDEIQLLPTGEQIIVTCRYEFSKHKVVDHYLFVKTKNDKATSALLLDMNKLGEEMSNYIISNIKKK